MGIHNRNGWSKSQIAGFTDRNCNYSVWSRPGGICLNYASSNSIMGQRILIIQPAAKVQRQKLYPSAPVSDFRPPSQESLSIVYWPIKMPDSGGTCCSISFHRVYWTHAVHYTGVSGEKQLLPNKPDALPQVTEMEPTLQTYSSEEVENPHRMLRGDIQ